MSNNSHLLTMISIFATVVIITFMDWVPTPLNRNIQGMSRHERLPSTTIHSALGIVFAIANLYVLKWVILVGAIWYSIVLLAAIRNWWLAYFAGAYQGDITPEIYLQHYARNFTILPRFHGNPVIPDLQHILIHLTLLAAGLLSWFSFWMA